MPADRTNLLAPLRIGPVTLPNRVVVPAMVTRLSGEDGHVNADIVDRYVRYAQGRVGLIVVEAMAVHSAKSGPLLRISGDEFVPGHRELVRRVHDTSDSKVVPQIIHFMKVARSGWRQTIDSLSRDDIELIVRQFGDAARRAREAGYDGVELHSAHAYTLSSFVSRLNPRRDEYGGRSLETRLAMFGRVMAEVRRQVGRDFAVGARFLADEMIKDGYTVEDAKRIALRMCQLGVDYVSLSVGGKFEDAVHREGQPLYPYTGYSGDRCMPGDWYPPLPHVGYAAEIRRYVRSHGYTVPIVSAGKISDPADAEQLLASGQADLIGMARQLLSDPDWVVKVAERREHEIVRCIYCNVCKQLDENFREVHCFLWPKGARQAPSAASAGTAPGWPDGGAGLTVDYAEGWAQLKWREATGDATGYDVYRAEAGPEGVAAAGCIAAAKNEKFRDTTVLGGLRYTYYVRPFDAAGRAGPPSNAVTLEAPAPELATS
jgi:2,4-dienoyl-CoA reductase-like NADH-dependent reductase (Old Yellow Enzyme family)